MATWISYKSDLETFSASFPGAATRLFHGFWPDDGCSPASVEYSCETENAHLYEVRVTRVMEYYGSADDFLQTVLREMTKIVPDVDQVEQWPSAFHSLPAIGFRMRVRKTHAMSGTAVLNGNTVYIASVFAPTGSPVDLKRFLDGFVIGV